LALDFAQRGEAKQEGRISEEQEQHFSSPADAVGQRPRRGCGRRSGDGDVGLLVIAGAVGTGRACGWAGGRGRRGLSRLRCRGCGGSSGNRRGLIGLRGRGGFACLRCAHRRHKRHEEQRSGGEPTLGGHGDNVAQQGCRFARCFRAERFPSHSGQRSRIPKLRAMRREMRMGIFS
jgi:hypothetical protein